MSGLRARAPSRLNDSALELSPEGAEALAEQLVQRENLGVRADLATDIGERIIADFDAVRSDYHHDLIPAMCRIHLSQRGEGVRPGGRGRGVRVPMAGTANVCP